MYGGGDTWPGVLPRSALARLRPAAGRGDSCRLAWASASASRAAASRFSLFTPRFAALIFCTASSRSSHVWRGSRQWPEQCGGMMKLMDWF
jgi:hypothetical protein